MILQTAKNTVYYPRSKSKVSGLIHSNRIRYFRGTVLVSEKYIRACFDIAEDRITYK